MNFGRFHDQVLFHLLKNLAQMMFDLVDRGL